MFLLTIVINVVIVLLTLASEKDRVTRVTYLGLNIAFFCYSCFGIYTYKLDDVYYLSYLLCVLALNVSFAMGTKLCRRIYEKKQKKRLYGKIEYSSLIDKINNLLESKFFIIKLLAIIYFAIRVFELFYPEFTLKYLFSGPNFSYDSLLEATRSNYNTLLGHLLSTIKTVLLPFAYFYLSTKSNKFLVGYFAFDLLAQYLMGGGAIGRLAIIQILLVMCLVFYSRAKTTAEKNKYKMVTMVVGVICFMVYVFMQNLRSGINISFASINPFEAIKSFVDSEFFYPRNYPLADHLYTRNAYPASRFWLWLITLPIPKSFISIPGVDTTNSIIYRVFSYHYFGGHWYYEEGVGGMLISVMGDGIMVYGKYFAFLLIIPFAFFLAYYTTFLRNVKYGKVLYYTTFFQFIVSFRPGVQYALTKVNTYVSILIVLFVIQFFKTKKASVVEEI